MTGRSLGEALEAMHGARTRFSTLQAGVTRVVDHVLEARATREQAQEHLRARGMQSPPAGTSAKAPRRDGEVEGVGVVTTPLWVVAEMPTRLRLEESITYDGRPVTKVDVLDGSVWRGYDPERGARFQQGGYEGSHAFHEVGPLLDPSTLVAGQDLEVTGEATWAGRAAIRIAARPRPLLFAHYDSAILLFGGTEHELLVDAERGVLLRLESRFDEQPFRVFEFGDVSFDAQIPASAWEVLAPDGRPPEPLEPRHNRPISLADAIARAPCKLFLPDRAPAGSELSIMVAPDWGDPAKARAIMFAYSWTGGTHRVQIHESPRRSAFLDDVEGWQEVSRDGQRILVHDGGADPSGMHLRRYATLERETTHIEISGNLALDSLVDLAATMAPVDATAPS